MDASDTILTEWANIYADILINKNLEAHRQQLLATIGEIDILIDNAKSKGEITKGYDELKNQLHFLLYEIAERI